MLIYDLFVHYSYITMDGYKSLKAGEPVEYDIREAPKGLHAINVVCLEERSDNEEIEDLTAEREAYAAKAGHKILKPAYDQQNQDSKEESKESAEYY